MRPFRRLKVLLVVLVIAHLGIAVVHGIAHDNAMVSLSPAATAFVYIVILIAPLAGLAITLLKPRGGAALVSASMVGALIFGVVNHFLLSSPDHVSQVDPRWRALFASTAILLALSEAAAAIVAGLVASKAHR